MKSLHIFQLNFWLAVYKTHSLIYWTIVNYFLIPLFDKFLGFYLRLLIKHKLRFWAYDQGSELHGVLIPRANALKIFWNTPRELNTCITTSYRQGRHNQTNYPSISTGKEMDSYQQCMSIRQNLDIIILSFIDILKNSINQALNLTGRGQSLISIISNEMHYPFCNCQDKHLGVAVLVVSIDDGTPDAQMPAGLIQF